MQRASITRERLGGLCLLGVLLFSPLVVSIFDQGPNEQIFSIPLLVFYLFGSWAALILAAAFLIRHHYKEYSQRDSDKKG